MAREVPARLLGQRLQNEIKSRVHGPGACVEADRGQASVTTTSAQHNGAARTTTSHRRARWVTSAAWALWASPAGRDGRGRRLPDQLVCCIARRRLGAMTPGSSRTCAQNDIPSSLHHDHHGYLGHGPQVQ